MTRATSGQDGQGLVEYAMILVLVIIALMISLMSLGITVANVLYNPIVERFDEGALLGVIAERAGWGNGNDLIVTITVSTGVSVTATDSQSGQSATIFCPDTCQHIFVGVGHDRGTVTVNAGMDTGMAAYPPQP